MAATIDDVAKKAAVSTATVSRALRGLPNVAPATRDHILSIAKELDYVVGPRATRAVSGSKRIAIMSPLVDQWFFSKLSTIITIKLIAAGFEVVRFGVDGIKDQSQKIEGILQQGLIDGLVVITFPLEDITITNLQAYQIPCVTLEFSSGVFPSVYINNVAAAELATQHLINLGHRRIGFISSTNTNEAIKDWGILDARREGYRSALTKAGIEYDEVLELSGNDVYEGGAEAMKHLYSLTQPPTAIFAASDEMAVGALKTLADLHLSVPKDVSIIGFDDNDLAHYVGLTTIRQPVTLLGELASEKLIACLSGGLTDYDFDTELGFQIILRTSTGPAKS